MYDEDGRWYPTDGFEAARHGMMNKDWASETTKTIKGLEEEIRLAEIKEDQDYLSKLANENILGDE